jgi:predicted ATP-binding protein involved in virulence
MRLERIKLENFRAKKDLTVKFGNRLTLLIGANGSGKTSILDGISIGLGSVLTYLPNLSGRSFKKNGDILQHDNKVEPYTRIALEMTSGLKWDRFQRRDKSKSTSQLVPKGYGVRDLEHFLDTEIIDPLNRGDDYLLPLFVYYGVSRALLDLPLTRKGFPKRHHRFEALVSALNAYSRFKSAFIWFYNKENEERRLQKEQRNFDVTLKELDVVRKAISAMFPDISEPHIDVNPLRFLIKHDSEVMNIEQMSDGYKTLLGVVIDLSSRLAMANPHLEDPLSAEAIVMIDEVDLHLHPSWQQRVMGDLLNTFKNTQFIVTTHSPYIVESINNYLKRKQIDELPIKDDYIKRLFMLNPNETEAYVMTEEGELSLMDSELHLLNDKLLENFNTMNQLYDKMRDIEWENKS